VAATETVVKVIAPMHSVVGWLVRITSLFDEVHAKKMQNETGY
jgi:hypothetical protein